MADAAYQAKYLGIARMLWQASERDFSSIPEDYCEHLRHEYVDGDISLAPLLSKFESFSELDDHEFEEAVEILGKVNPEDWPSVEDIELVYLDLLLQSEGEYAHDYVEDNLTTGERTEKVLAEAIKSVFGAPVTKIRNEKGYYPNVVNNFLQQEDGTFMGTFEYQGNQFLFEVYPDEEGWVVTYRMSPDSLDDLPPVPLEDQKEKEKPDYTRHIRHRGWR